MFFLPERFQSRSRHNQWMLLRCLCVLAFLVQVDTLKAEAITTPLPVDIASRLGARAAKARLANATLRSYLLYKEAAKLDPLNANYRENRDQLEPIARLLEAQHLETADIQPDIEASKLEATPGSDAAVALRVAQKAERARKSGQAVRAYLLYKAAAARCPDNVEYRENRNVLAPVAAMLQNTELDKQDISADLKAAELESLSGPDPAVVAAGGDWEADHSLAALPHIQVPTDHHDFNLRGDPATLVQQVTSVYGIRAISDPDLPKSGNIVFRMTDVDFRTALEGLTAVTKTFVFPVSTSVLFFAEDTEAKRNEMEPNVLLTVSLPDSLNDKDLVDVANSVRSVLNLKNFGWDSINHTVMIRDRFTRAHLAKSLLESLLVPHAQVALELEFVALDSDVVYQWGITPQTSFQILSPLQKLFNFQTVLPTLISGAKYIAFGGGLGTLGIGITSAQLLATYSKSTSNVAYDTTIVVEDGATANLHVGEKYPIPTALYQGASQTTSSIYNPVGTFNQEDLGLVLKVTPHVKGDGEVGMDIEADYKALGTQTFNTVPSVAERKFTGNVMLQQNEWAIVAGLDQSSKLSSKDGYPGITEIPLLSDLLSNNNRETTSSKTLIVLKPMVRRLPMSDAVTPQFLVGPVRGVRVLL